MTNCMSRSAELSVNKHESLIWCDAQSRAGVRYAMRRVSFGGRIELARKIRDVGRRVEFFEAGARANDDAKDRMEATVLAAEIDRAYLEWGLVGVEGLEIDGAIASRESLIDDGPVELAVEILARIKNECGITEDERKN